MSQFQPKSRFEGKDHSYCGTAMETASKVLFRFRFASGAVGLTFSLSLRYWPSPRNGAASGTEVGQISHKLWDIIIEYR